jgi:type IV pilus assembly protein PilZ
MENQLDKRSAERAAITLRVDYKRLNTFFADYTKNISKGGTFIKTIKPLDVGTTFVFVLQLPTIEKQIELVGEVVWITEENDATADKPAGMGIRFVFSDDARRKEVSDFVEMLMIEQLGEHLSGKLLAKRP